MRNFSGEQEGYLETIRRGLEAETRLALGTTSI